MFLSIRHTKIVHESYEVQTPYSFDSSEICISTDYIAYIFKTREGDNYTGIMFKDSYHCFVDIPYESMKHILGVKDPADLLPKKETLPRFKDLEE